MRLTLCIVSAQPELLKRTVEHAFKHAAGPLNLVYFANGWSLQQNFDLALSLPVVAPPRHDVVQENQGVAVGLHRIYELVCREDRDRPADPHDDILVYLHDDVDILEQGWDMRVRSVFQGHPDVGLAGFGCALGLGEPEIYKVPYQLHHVGRNTFGSNMEGAEIHGFRFSGDREAAAPDGFSIIVRRSLLDKIGGWSWFPFVHHVYDYAIACQARRHGMKCWLIGVNVKHWGGKTACGPIHQEMAKKFGGDTKVHADAHRWLYDNFRDVLPFRVA